MKNHSKLSYQGQRIELKATDVSALLIKILQRSGCPTPTAQSTAEHLIDTSLCGIESHGIMRVLQYVEQIKTGYLNSSGIPQIKTSSTGACIVDGDAGIGIPAMELAYNKGIELTEESGISALAIRNVGHTGRHGSYADYAANRGFLTICVGGGNRKIWRQVAPHGGAKAMLPTNPWCIGIPGGNQGPVILDFATSKIAGGWIYAAQSAGAQLPEDCLIDKHGRPTTDPNDYFAGGAILPAGGHKGYGLALVGELIGEAMLGPATTECHWLLITLATQKFREAGALQTAAEEVLLELRECPPAEGFDHVEIPGERERKHKEASNGIIRIPEKTWGEILALAAELNIK
jgi:LDH2 family malate/lactate/ureidoglycolate dehydrogenase